MGTAYQKELTPLDFIECRKRLLRSKDYLQKVYYLPTIAAMKARHGHGGTKWRGPTREYSTWSAMKQRCQNPNDAAYKMYGGRGITVCERWQIFENFLADMGPKPEGFTIDRINNDGNYEPGNVRWATREEQVENRRPPERWKRRWNPETKRYEENKP